MIPEVTTAFVSQFCGSENAVNTSHHPAFQETGEGKNKKSHANRPNLGFRAPYSTETKRKTFGTAAKLQYFAEKGLATTSSCLNVGTLISSQYAAIILVDSLLVSMSFFLLVYSTLLYSADRTKHNVQEIAEMSMSLSRSRFRGEGTTQDA